MYKIFKNFSFLILSVLSSTVTLQAVGGSGVEEVPNEEIKRKGILKVQYADDSEFGTAVLFQEGKGLIPAVHRLFLAIHWAVLVEKPMTRIRVHMEFIHLAVFLEFLLLNRHLCRRGTLIFFTKQT